MNGCNNVVASEINYIRVEMIADGLKVGPTNASEHNTDYNKFFSSINQSTHILR